MVLAQNNSYVTKSILFVGDTIKFDTISVFNSGFQLKSNKGDELVSGDYYLDAINASLFLDEKYLNQQFSIRYERFPIDLSLDFQHKNDSLIITDNDTIFDPYIYSVSTKTSTDNLFGTNSLYKQGSISRGVTVGNSQNLSLQSTLNLQLNGKIGPDLYMKGAISDNNVPFQPQGNTQKLQDFDQVYMQIYNDDFSVIGGDFWLKKPQGYFLNYNKRTQGMSIEYFQRQADTVKSSHKISGAFSRGKFARNVIQGVEGNQGPYRLTGAENEQFIVVLAGTEKVYIDGELLKRGQEFDYIIDYNTSEIVFTANQLITKDKRMIVEFQYSDLNYARSLVAYNGTFTGDKYKAWINYYSEQDAKNQPIQQSLSQENKNGLALAGDSLNSALFTSIDSVGYFDNRVLYTLTDSLGYDSLLVFSVNPNEALYQASFQFVGANNGNYVLDEYTANGKVYKWVQPINGVLQGNYEPLRLLVAPQRKQMLSAGVRYQIVPSTSLFSEIAWSSFDKNTFSNLHQSDNSGVALKLGSESNFKLDSNRRNIITNHFNFEYNHENFIPIQWFRSAEFDRDWNVRNRNYSGQQFISSADVGFLNSKYGKVNLETQNLIWGDDYNGFRNNLGVNFNKNGLMLIGDASLLLSDGQQESSNFLRHNIKLDKSFRFVKFGLESIHENNRFFGDQNNLLLTSYQFYDAKVFVASSDSLINKYELSYQQRHDWMSDSTDLNHAAKAQVFGVSTQFLKNKINQLKLNVNYRILDVLDSTLLNIKPENTILGRIENNLRTPKGLITSNTFYELGSGLELKKEFIFIQVNPGQGTHAWIDYNNDGVKDLGEFEISQFSDQAEYIRVFIPTNEYVRTYSNQFSQTLFLKPEKLWRNKKGLRKQIARFSNQTVYKVTRKTNYESGLEAFNPFTTSLADSILVSNASSFRNTTYFNRTHSKFGLDYSYQENSSKILLSNGFDSRSNTLHKTKLRWNISSSHTIKTEGILGRKKSSSDYAPARNYFINYYQINSVYSFQPNAKLRVAFLADFSNKANQSELNETAVIRNFGTEFRYNQAKKGSFLAQFNFIQIDYNATNNSSLAYEMLEGLKTGNNFTVGLSYQRKVAKNLQLNFNYNGRKSEGNQMIHSGGMELRAFF